MGNGFWFGLKINTEWFTVSFELFRADGGSVEQKLNV